MSIDNLPSAPSAGSKQRGENYVALCQVCPHPTCPGIEKETDPAACRTVKTQLAGHISFSHALEAKHNQTDRHRRTDDFREYAYHRVLADQPLKNHRIKSLTTKFTSFVAKGYSPYEVRRSSAFLALDVSDECCMDLLKSRYELDPDRTSLY
jgi:hypothetical protein